MYEKWRISILKQEWKACPDGWSSKCKTSIVLLWSIHLELAEVHLEIAREVYLKNSMCELG